MHKATIKDIAGQAGVSTTAVSMALNKRGGVSEKTRKRILKIAEKLDYQPNLAAKSLVSNRTQTIGLVMNNIADPFYPEMALGIEEKAAEHGYSLLVSNIGGCLDKEKKSIDMLRARGVDGVIITTATSDDPNIGPLAEAKFPLVLVSRFSMDPALKNRIDYVVVDDHACGYQGVAHLYRLGHDRIALITGTIKASTTAIRVEASKQALNDFGMDTDSQLVVACDFVRQRAQEAAKALLAMKNRPTAFFAQDDYMAMGVREAILNENLRIPEDIALMGVDDIEMASLAGVDLTTIKSNPYQMGATGAEILINKIELSDSDSAMVNQVIMETRLIKRKSCGFHATGYVR
ncbi:MAG: LacI family DNA-binding transcriptional regulator [Deltaproteobacteria bacterium]|nr:LacI family DNA-binding transcriptional regulator [Deltaproteobacteria bacterium]